MSLQRMLNFKIGEFLETVDVAAISYNEANQSECVGNMTELKAIIGQTNDNNIRFINVHGSSVAQRCIGHLSDIDTIDNMVQAHKNTFGHFEKTHQRLNDDIRMAKLAWDDLTPDKSRPKTIVLKKEKPKHCSMEKLAELKAELARLKTEQRRLMGIIDEYQLLCDLEDKQSKKNKKFKSKAHDNDLVSSNQS